MRSLYVAAFLALQASPSQAADPAAMREAIGMASEICGEYQRAGSSSDFELSGTAEAKIKGLLKNFVDVGIEGNASTSGAEYDNVIRDELGKELQSTRNCRQDMTKFLLDKMELSKDVTPAPDPTPANFSPDISGVWSYSGTCPYGYGSVAVQGEFQMQRVGETQYSGQAYSSLGLTGQFQTTVSGSNVRSDIRWSDYSFETANGQLSADGRVMDIIDTAGCQTRAFLMN